MSSLTTEKPPEGYYWRNPAEAKICDRVWLSRSLGYSVIKRSRWDEWMTSQRDTCDGTSIHTVALASRGSSILLSARFVGFAVFENYANGRGRVLDTAIHEGYESQGLGLSLVRRLLREAPGRGINDCTVMLSTSTLETEQDLQRYMIARTADSELSMQTAMRVRLIETD